MLSISKLKEAGIARDIRKKINECIDAITALRIADGPGYRVKRTARGTVLGIDRDTDVETVAGGDVQRFKITSIASTWLVCRKVDSAGAETSSTDYKVMRPEFLRTNKGMLSGNTSTPSLTSAQSRTYDITRNNPTGVGTTNYTITEILWPNYTAGNFIFGINPIIGGTVDDGAGGQVDWIDLNIDARRWQLELQPTEVCVSGATRKSVIARSDAEV